MVLELRGAPGGENSDASCGRFNESWNPSSWNVEATVQIVRAVADKYRNARAVVGFSVLGLPSAEIPVQTLVKYYSDAYNAVRGAGMVPQAVTVHFAVPHRRRVQDFLALGFPPRDMQDITLDLTRTLLPDDYRQISTLAQVLGTRPTAPNAPI